MTNAEKAISIIIEYLESEGIMAGTAEITKNVDYWESKLDPIDPMSLAAVAIANPYESALTNSEIREIRNFYFSSEKFY
jgi:hypothetical protein